MVASGTVASSKDAVLRLLMILAALILTAFAIPSRGPPLHSQTLFLTDLPITPVLNTQSDNPDHANFRQCPLGSSLIVDFELHPLDCLVDGCSFQLQSGPAGTLIPLVPATVAPSGAISGSTTTTFAGFGTMLDIDGALDPDDNLNLTTTFGNNGTLPGGLPVSYFLNSVLPAFPITFRLTTNDDLDDGACNPSHCSFREAINAANANGATDVIVPGVVDLLGDNRINLGSPPPAIVDDVTIDGNGQLEINDAGIGDAADSVGALLIAEGKLTLLDTVINGFPSAAVLLDAVGPHTIEGNVFGANATGTADIANSAADVVVSTGEDGDSVNADVTIDANTHSGGVEVKGMGKIKLTMPTITGIVGGRRFRLGGSAKDGYTFGSSGSTSNTGADFHLRHRAQRRHLAHHARDVHQRGIGG